MTAETDLLPCPFCGAAEPIVAEHPNLLPPSFRVICSGGVCHAMVEARTLVRARLMWNRRAGAAKDAKIEEAKDDAATFHRLAMNATERADRLAEALRELADAVFAEFCGDETESMEPDDSKVSYPEDRCHITFGMIRRARAALEQENGRE